MFEIEKDIPLPSAKTIYPFDEMTVKDSFFLPKGKANAAKSAASLYGKRKGKKFTVRAWEDGFRC